MHSALYCEHRVIRFHYWSGPHFLHGGCPTPYCHVSPIYAVSIEPELYLPYISYNLPVDGELYVIEGSSFVRIPVRFCWGKYGQRRLVDYYLGFLGFRIEIFFSFWSTIAMSTTQTGNSACGLYCPRN